MTMAKVDTRFAEAERKASVDSEADHATGAATREAAAQQGLATLTRTAVVLGAANTAAQHAQANAAAAKAAVDAKTAHDHAEQTYRDARDEATAWLAEKEAKATKARADALHSGRPTATTTSKTWQRWARLRPTSSTSGRDCELLWRSTTTTTS